MVILMEIFSLHSLAIIGVLVLLEGLLSLDNALVLAMMAKEVDPAYRKKALTYGLIGAIAFRIGAIGLATVLIRYHWVKVLGGAYLLWLVVKHFFFNAKSHAPAHVKHQGFWKTVFMIELTDIAFAIDSILAAVALTNQFWLIVIGGLIGTVMMRFAANAMIKLLEKFPRMEPTAYLLIAIIGTKVILQGLQLPGVDFESKSSPWFWGEWILMAVCIAIGLRRGKPKP